MEHEPAGSTSSCNQRLTKTEALQHFQAARVDRQRARFMCAIQQTVDDAEPGAESVELRGEREPGRAGTYDHDIKFIAKQDVAFPWGEAVHFHTSLDLLTRDDWCSVDTGNALRPYDQKMVTRVALTSRVSAY